MYNYTKSNPQALSKMEEKAKAYQEAAVKSNFSKIELTDDEYKFYMDPQIWVKLPENSKRAKFLMWRQVMLFLKNILILNLRRLNKALWIFVIRQKSTVLLITNFWLNTILILRR